MVSVTHQLAEFAVNLTLDDIPAEVRARAKALIFDTVGIALRARHDTQSTRAMLAALARLEMTQGRAHVIGDSQTYPAAVAALRCSTTRAARLRGRRAQGRTRLHTGSP